MSSPPTVERFFGALTWVEATSIVSVRRDGPWIPCGIAMCLSPATGLGHRGRSSAVGTVVKSCLERPEFLSEQDRCSRGSDRTAVGT